MNRQPEELYTAVGRAVIHRLFPFRAGRRLVIAPSWMEVPCDTIDLWIRLNQERTGAHLDAKARPLAAASGRADAFGTGLHPTTYLMLDNIENMLHGGETVVDLGTGSGLLAVAAAGLGASLVLALDVDPASLAVARETVALNRAGHIVQVEYGSLDWALAAGIRADLILANILTPVLVSMLQQGLAQLLLPDGQLAISGIKISETETMAEALQTAGLQPEVQKDLAGWSLLIARRG